jgi:tRNA threonylcarbamoyladenosine biosynthesis protein TsaE
MELIFTIQTIKEAAVQFAGVMGENRVFAFNGDMGAGKTTFIHALCGALEVSSPVGSPTFSIINQYRYPGGVIYHMDLYRIKDEEEAIRAGVEDTLYSGNICLVEWPERAPQIFPENTVFVFIEAVDEHTRRIGIEDK